LERLLATMQTPSAAPAPVPPEPPKTTTTVVPKADVDEYGEPLIDASRRWARVEFEHLIGDLTAKIHGLEAHITELRSGHQRTTQATLKTRQEAYFDADPELAAHWRQQNTDPEFLAWLRQPDEFAGVPRQQLLGQALQNEDLPRLARFFKAYLAEQTATPTPLSPQLQTPPAAPVPATGAGTVRLEDLAAPAGGNPASGVGGGAPGGEKRIYTRAQVSAFYRDVQRGKFVGNDAEKDRIERDIHAAATEGRIR
jgi:hypothetical protein